MKATEVFTPGTLPRYTYYARPGLALERSLRHAVETPGIIAAVSGPSKSGKTVLCETVVGLDSTLLVAGGGVDSEETLWQRIRSRLRVPAASSSSSGVEKSREVGANAKAGVGFLLKGEAGLDGKIGRSEQEQATSQFDPITGVDLIQRVKAAGKILVVDDFHYLNRNVQKSVVEQFKEAARAGCTIIVVSVPHRADDVLRANPDLRGRLRLVEVPYWTEDELRNIPKLGFPRLNFAIDDSTVARLAQESLSSPQLMQSLCLDLCRAKGIEEALPVETRLDVSQKELTLVLESVASTANCQTAVDILLVARVRGADREFYLEEEGNVGDLYLDNQMRHQERGTGPKTYTMRDGTLGDIYTVLLKAVATSEPKLRLRLPEIIDRVESITRGDYPDDSNIVRALTEMYEAVKKMPPGDRVIEWDNEKKTLNFPDPYFLYYLRWWHW